MEKPRIFWADPHIDENESHLEWGIREKANIVLKKRTFKDAIKACDLAAKNEINIAILGFPKKGGEIAKLLRQKVPGIKIIAFCKGSPQFGDINISKQKGGLTALIGALLFNPSLP